MKVFGDKVNDVDMAGLMAQSEFTITDGSKIIEMILDNAYTDPITATVREIGQNASEVDPDWHFHFPTMLEPFIAITDNGTGMSKEDVITFASGIGASTKDGDNSKVGGFGIGLKVPFTMSDQYTLISKFEGMEYSFTAFKDDMGRAQFIQNYERGTDDPNGFEVRVPVDADDFDEVKTKAIAAYQYFDPKPSTNMDIEWEEAEYDMQGDDWGLLTKQENRYGYKPALHRSKAIMGNLWYPIESSEISEEYQDQAQVILDHGIDLRFPIGALKLPLSREGILYNDNTKAKIREKVEEIAQFILDEFERTVSSAPSLWEAMKLYNNSSRMVTRLQHKSINDITCKGHVVTNAVKLKLPCDAACYVIDKSRFRLKTLNLQQHRLNKHIEDGTVYIGYQENKNVMVVSDDTKRIPSRLLSYVKEFNKTDQTYLFQCAEEDKAELFTYLQDVVGLHDGVDFDVVVPEYKLSKEEREKYKTTVTKLVTFHNKRQRHGWHRSDKDHWNKSSPVELDTSTGIYIDLRNYEPHDSKYITTTNQLNSVYKYMMDGGFIPKDAVLFGCPGSVKNKLKDHTNFIHIDEAIDLCLEVYLHLNEGKAQTYARYEGVVDFVNDNNSLFDKSIEVEGSFFTLLSNIKRNFKETISKAESYTTYQGMKGISNVVSQLRDAVVVNVSESSIEESIERRFKVKYPLLSHINMYNVNEMDVQEYIYMKENCEHV
jgi:hypothetical protein